MTANARPRIVSIGECMVELARRSDGAFNLAVGGDTFNTAIYLARLGADVTYVTAVGDDPYSAQIIETARGEGVGTSGISVVAGRMPGLYLIETSAGERTFWYWRDRAPARDVFELAGFEERLRAVSRAQAVYLSGITLSLYSATGLERLETALTAARAGGAIVAIDGNFRPVGWRHDLSRARATFERFWALADIALPTLDDERLLWPNATPEGVLGRLSGFGAGEIAVKLGADGALLGNKDCTQKVAVPERIDPVDTTAAGDAFSAAYLSSRLAGMEPVAAAEFGHRLAGAVIRHRGAIVPYAATEAIANSFG